MPTGGAAGTVMSGPATHDGRPSPRVQVLEPRLGVRPDEPRHRGALPSPVTLRGRRVGPAPAERVHPPGSLSRNGEDFGSAPAPPTAVTSPFAGPPSAVPSGRRAIGASAYFLSGYAKFDLLTLSPPAIHFRSPI